MSTREPRRMEHMGKLRVHELAKKLGLQNQELVEKLNKAGLSVKTHSSTVDEAEAMKAMNADRPKAAPVDAGRPRTMVRRTPAMPEPVPEPVKPEPPPPPVVVARPVERPVPVEARPEPRPALTPIAEQPAAPVAAETH